MNKTDNRLEFLKGEIDKRIKSFESKRDSRRNQSSLLFMISAVISAITTILLGLNIANMQDYFKMIALGLSATATVINAYNSFYSNRELWVAFNRAINELLHLKFNIEFAENGINPIVDQDIEIYKTTYQKILDEVNESWRKNRSIEKEDK
jgi:hypothetical protein